MAFHHWINSVMLQMLVMQCLYTITCVCTLISVIIVQPARKVVDRSVWPGSVFGSPRPQCANALLHALNTMMHCIMTDGHVISCRGLFDQLVLICLIDLVLQIP